MQEQLDDPVRLAVLGSVRVHQLPLQRAGHPQGDEVHVQVGQAGLQHSAGHQRGAPQRQEEDVLHRGLHGPRPLSPDSSPTTSPPGRSDEKVGEKNGHFLHFTAIKLEEEMMDVYIIIL